MRSVPVSAAISRRDAPFSAMFTVLILLVLSDGKALGRNQLLLPSYVK